MHEDNTALPKTMENTLDDASSPEAAPSANSETVHTQEDFNPISEPESTEVTDDLPPGFSPEGLRRFLNGRHARQIAADMKLRDHFNQLNRQAQALKQQYPDFDLAHEMQNPAFARLTAPGVGIDPATAYEIVHHQSLQNAARRIDLERISKAIQSGSLRPAENALTGTHSPSPMKTDPRNLSPTDRDNIRRRVARGERVVL